MHPSRSLSWYVGAYLVSQVIGRRVHVDVPTALFGEINGGRDTDDTADGDARRHGWRRRRRWYRDDQARTAPSFATVLGMLLLPFVLISFNTVLNTLMTAGVIDEGATWARVPAS